LIRSASAVVVPGRSPSSRSACQTHMRTDSTPHPSWSATRSTVPFATCQAPRAAGGLTAPPAFSLGVYRRAVACWWPQTGTGPRSRWGSPVISLACLTLRVVAVAFGDDVEHLFYQGSG
jgi:hypothetical protein